MDDIKWIKTVKQTEGGWQVNGTMGVPDADGNRHARDVREWIAAGNRPEPADPAPEPTPNPLVETVGILRKIALNEATEADRDKLRLLGTSK